MARKSTSKKPAAPSGPRKFSKNDGKINRIERYEDTLEEGGVDDFMFKRDKISLTEQEYDDSDEDLLTGETEGVMDLDFEGRRPRQDESEEEYDEDDEDDTPKPSKKDLKAVKAAPAKKGRFAKSASQSSASGSGSESGSDDPDAEGWGRSYYSRPSTRRGREEDEEDDEEREEERKMEEKEVRRLQRKARESVRGDGDWGLEGLGEAIGDSITLQNSSSSKPLKALETIPTATSLPSSTAPQVLIRHLQTNDPVKLALAREFPLVIKKLEKTERGIRKMKGSGKGKEKEQGENHEEQQEGPAELHSGLGWLHYQILLTYSTTLAFYLHLAALPLESRPDFAIHPILPRLLQLKQGLAMLEDLDFAAGSDDEGDLIELFDGMEDSEEEEEEGDEVELSDDRKRELVGLLGGDVDWTDADELWEGGELEEDELEELKRDAEADIREARREKAAKKAASAGLDLEAEDEDDDESPEDETEAGDFDDFESDMDLGDRSLSPSPIPVPVAKKGKSAIKSTNVPSYTLLQEPDFVPSTRKLTKFKAGSAYEDDRGDPTSLNTADAMDKTAKTRSLRFHTSKIAATSARRSAARQERMGGDDDVPYRDRKAARDDALKKNGPKGDAGEDLDGSEWTEKDRKRAREVMEMGEGGEHDDGDDGYYELVKRQKTEQKKSKKEAHDEMVAAEKEAIIAAHEGSSSGPRGLTRSIEKNRGLTPHRKKSVRNPRVKKREVSCTSSYAADDAGLTSKGFVKHQAYEKAKQKVGSMRAVYKGGQGALGGNYEGEKTGISTTVKSRRF